MGTYYFLFLAILIGLVYPGYGFKNADNARRMLELYQNEKQALYLSTIILQWLLTITVLCGMWYFNESWSLIGMQWLNNPWDILSLIFPGLLFWLLIRQIPLRDSELPRMNRYYSQIMMMMPFNERDYRTSIALAFTAGFCEELLFRGFLFWQVSLYLPPWPTIFLVNIAFALGHVVSGWRNTSYAFLLGLLWSVIFFYTGSLWWAVLSHILLDLFSLTRGYLLSQKQTATTVYFSDELPLKEDS